MDLFFSSYLSISDFHQKFYRLSFKNLITIHQLCCIPICCLLSQCVIFHDHLTTLSTRKLVAQRLDHPIIYKSNWIALFKTLQWPSTYLIIKAKYLKMGKKALKSLTQTRLPVLSVSPLTVFPRTLPPWSSWNRSGMFPCLEYSFPI